MAKNKKTSLFAYLPLLLAVVAVVVFLIMDVVIYKTNYFTRTFKGAGVVFGYKNPDTDSEVFGFSVMLLIALGLVIGGGVLPALNVKLFTLIGAVAAIVGAVLLFLTPNFIVYANKAAELLYDGNLKIATGSIISAVCALGTGLVGLYNVSKK